MEMALAIRRFRMGLAYKKYVAIFAVPDNYREPC